MAPSPPGACILFEMFFLQVSTRHQDTTTPFPTWLDFCDDEQKAVALVNFGFLLRQAWDGSMREIPQPSMGQSREWCICVVRGVMVKSTYTAGDCLWRLE